MAHSKQALKRLRQDAKKRLHNRSIKATMATFEKKFLAAVESNDKDAAAELLKACISKFDKAAKKGIIKKNKADRKKSRLTIKLNSIAG